MAKKTRVNIIFSFLARVLLSVGLLVYIFSKIDMEKTKDILLTADLKYILYALIIFVVINMILLTRWFIFIRALDVQVRIKSIIRYFFIGLFGNLFLPSAVGGDLIKMYGLCKETDKKARVVASVLLDRLSGFASITIVSVLAFMIGYRYIEDNSLLWPIVILASGSLLVASVLFNEKIYSFGCKIFNAVPKIKNSLMQLHYDMSLMKTHKAQGVKAILISCLSQIVFAFTFYLSAKALHQNVAVIYFLIFVPLICVASSVPSIGGLGVREAGAAYLFAKAGMDSGVAVSLSLISFLFMVIVGLIGGIFYVSTLSSGRVQLDPPDAECDLKIQA